MFMNEYLYQFKLFAIWTMPVIALLTLVLQAIDKWKFLWFLRFLLWPMRKRQFAAAISRSGAFVSYLMLIWLETEARGAYINGGGNGIVDAAKAHLDKISSTLQLD